MIREQIIQTLQNRLAGLTTANVLRCEDYSDEEEYICIWDGAQQTEKSPYGSYEHTMEVIVQWLKKSVTGNPGTACNAMYEQLHVALHNDSAGNLDASINGFGRMAENSYTPLVPDLGLKVTGVVLSLQATYTTAIGNPAQSV